MPPFLIPSLVKFTLGAAGAAAAVHWLVKEARRINRELDPVQTAPVTDQADAANPADAAARSAHRRLAGDVGRAPAAADGGQPRTGRTAAIIATGRRVGADRTRARPTAVQSRAVLDPLMDGR